MQDRPSPLLISILCIGIAILYIPILVLIGYSFNASVAGERLGRLFDQLVHGSCCTTIRFSMRHGCRSKSASSSRRAR